MRDERAGAHLFKVSLSSIKRYVRAWSLSSSTQGKDNRRVEVTKVVLLYRTNLPYGVKPSPWHVRPNRLSKTLEELHLLLLTEQRFTSGKTLKLKDEFRFVILKLLRDLLGHPIEPRGDLLLIFHVVRGFGSECKRYSVTHPVTIFSEGTLW